MIDLLSPEGREALQKTVTSATLLAFDLDGTLAPIVDDPTKVALSPAIRQQMQQLSSLAPTAIITGRSCGDARQRLGFEPRYLVGNHGLEGLPDSPGVTQELSGIIEGWCQQLEKLLAPELLQMLYLEKKSGSLSLHYRQVPDPQAAHILLLMAIQQLEPGPRLVGGKFVENLIPDGLPHKGDALLRLMTHAGSPAALFLGDDETDEDVFRLDDPRILSVSVGQERVTAARYVVYDQMAMGTVLDQLLHILKQVG